MKVCGVVRARSCLNRGPSCSRGGILFRGSLPRVSDGCLGSVGVFSYPRERLGRCRCSAIGGNWRGGEGFDRCAPVAAVP